MNRFRRAKVGGQCGAIVRHVGKVINTAAGQHENKVIGFATYHGADIAVDWLQIQAAGNLYRAGNQLVVFPRARTGQLHQCRGTGPQGHVTGKAHRARAVAR